MARLGNIAIENARITFRNFSGKEDRYNPKGNRNFTVLLDDPELVQRLEKDGWNVKYLKALSDEDHKQPILQVSVKYDPIPPKIMLVTKSGKTILDEESVSTLDWADIENVDVIITPYEWEVNGKTGVKAYCKTMYVTIVEDEFADKYREFDEDEVND